jgi:exosortase E/protease (VPEID-CTERM system)
LWLAKKIRFFVHESEVQKREEVAPAPSQPVEHDSDLAISTLVPMVVLLAVILISSAITAGFDWLYPLRVVAVVGALYWVSKHLDWRPYRVRLEAFVAGALVALIWIGILVGSADESNSEFSETLWSVELWLAYLWLVCRFIGSAVTVPIAEELAFRAYILCKLSRVPVTIRGSIPVSVIAVLVSSLAFGALHGAWIAGTIAGLIYALVRLRSEHIGDAIVAHAVTNAILFAYALMSGEWVLI